MWEVDQKYLRYIYFDKNLDKAKYLYSFLLKINILDIKSI